MNYFEIQPYSKIGVRKILFNKNSDNHKADY